MRPSYLVVGAKRGGSTALAAWMSRHPQVAPCRSGKGTHYFDVNYGRGRSWFLSRFEKPHGAWRVTGEASPYYMFHPLAPTRIKETLPDVRLIVALREPAARAWSQFRRETDTGYEHLGFLEALAAEEQRLVGEVERMLSDPTYESDAHRHHSYRARGRYAEQLQLLHDLFGPDRVLVLQSEAIFDHPNAELAKVWDFLGLDRVELKGLAAMKPSLSEQEPPAGALDELRSYYAPLNQQLYSMPGVDFRWTGAEAS
ncbi:MAG TPA: sulfotransferase [Dermatophilaceae bacterium]|nr:sulfotransferase [Dermatophilaceae bacterium]